MNLNPLSKRSFITGSLLGITGMIAFVALLMLGQTLAGDKYHFFELGIIFQLFGTGLCLLLALLGQTLPEGDFPATLGFGGTALAIGTLMICAGMYLQPFWQGAATLSLVGVPFMLAAFGCLLLDARRSVNS